MSNLGTSNNCVITSGMFYNNEVPTYTPPTPIGPRSPWNDRDIIDPLLLDPIPVSNTVGEHRVGISGIAPPTGCWDSASDKRYFGDPNVNGWYYITGSHLGVADPLQVPIPVLTPINLPIPIVNFKAFYNACSPGEVAFYSSAGACTIMETPLQTFPKFLINVTRIGIEPTVIYFVNIQFFFWITTISVGVSTVINQLVLPNVITPVANQPSNRWFTPGALVVYMNT